MAGSFKVLYTHFRTVRHASREEQLEHGSMIRVASPVTTPPGKLQTGFEVDGVWVSHSSSPSGSPSPLEPETPQFEQTAAFKSRSAINLALSKNNRDLTPRDVHPAMREQSPIGQTGSREDYVPYVLRSPTPRQVLDELDAVYRTPRWYREEALDDLLNDPIKRPPSIPPRSPKRTDLRSNPSQPADLTMLDRHRRAQVAETGQLTARAKKHDLTIDTKAAGRAKSETRQSTRFERVVDFIPSSTRAPLKAGRARSKPRDLVLPPPASNMPDAVPFKQFMANTGPPSPSSTFSEVEQREISKLLDYAYGNEQKSSNKHRTGPYELADTSPHRCSCQTSSSSDQSPRRSSREHGYKSSMDSSLGSQQDSREDSPRRTSFEKVGPKRDQILRGHDSGFEILRPGTLNEKGQREGRQQGPPISLHNYTRSRDESRGRRLQKKRRNSVDSQVSGRSTSTSGRRLSFSGILARLSGTFS